MKTPNRAPRTVQPSHLLPHTLCELVVTRLPFFFLILFLFSSFPFEREGRKEGEEV